MKTEDFYKVNNVDDFDDDVINLVDYKEISINYTFDCNNLVLSTIINNDKLMDKSEKLEICGLFF